MARKSTETQKKWRYSDGNAILSKLGVNPLRQLFSALFPDRKLTAINAQVVSLTCLATAVTGHIDTRPSMYINVAKGTIKCKACGYFTRNLLQLLSDARGLSFRDALIQIQTHTGIRVAPEKFEGDIEAYDLHQKAVEAMYYACNTYLLHLISPPADPEKAKEFDPITMEVATPTLEWLFHQREHKQEYVRALPYGVWPPQHMLFAYASEYLENQATDDYKRYQTTALNAEKREKILARVKEVAAAAASEWTYAVAYFNGHGMRTPGRIRLRKPALDNEKDGHYLLMPGSVDDEPIGYFGLWAPYLGGLSKNEAKDINWLLVEGENDMLSTLEGLLSGGHSSWAVIASNGAFNDLDALSRDAGIDEIYMMSDHPSLANGERWARERLKTAREIGVKVFRGWNEFKEVPGTPGDPDALVVMGGFPLFKKVVFDEKAKWFAPVDVWAADRAIEDALHYTTDEVRERTTVAVAFGECVRVDSQREQYITRICAALGLTPSVVRNEIIQAADDEAGFIVRLTEGLLRDFHVTYREETARGQILHLFHRASRRPVRAFVDNGEALIAMIANVAGDVYRYFAEQISIPGWILPQQGAGLVMPVKELQRTLGSYLKIAFQSIFCAVPLKDECRTLGQGIHVVEDVDAPNGVVFYIVNGPNVLKAKYAKPEGDELTAIRLDGPSDGRLIFDIQPQAVSPDLATPADVEAGNLITVADLRNTFLQLAEAIKTYWEFQHTAVDSLMLAGMLAGLSAPHLSDSRIHLELVGQPSSGKSTLLSLFCGGQYPELQVCGWAVGMADYTPASLYQRFGYTTLAMCLEEFTRDPLQPQTHKSRQVEDINQLLRQVIFPGGATVTRGSLDGKTVTRVIKTNIVTASINPAFDAQDASRRYTVETVKRTGKADPAAGLKKQFGLEGLAALRRTMTLGLLKYYKRVRDRSGPIEHELSTGALDIGFNVDSRFLRNFFGVAPLMDLLGEDWRAFVIAATKTRQDHLAATERSTLTNQLFDTIMRVNAVRVGANGATSSISSLLASSEGRWRQLNQAQCGVYYHEQHKLLAVDWASLNANNGLLTRTEPYCHANPTQMKYQMDQHSRVIRKAEMAPLMAEMTNWLQSLAVHVIGNELTFLRVSDMINQLRLHYKEPPKPEGNRTDSEETPRTRAVNDDGPPGLSRPRRSNGTL